MYDFDKLKEEFKNKTGYEPSQKELMQYIKDNYEVNNAGSNATNKSNGAGILLIIWFIASIVSLLLFSQQEKVTELVLVFVHYFLVFGLLALLSNKKNASIEWLFIVGLVFLAFLWLDPNGVKINIDSELIIFAGMGLVFFVTGIVFLGIGINSNVKKNKYISVNAIICEHIRHGKSKACVYEYEVDSQKYKVSDNFYTNVNVPELGSIKNIKVNPNNPTEILTSSSLSFFILFSIPFIVMGGLFLLVGLGFFK